MILITGTTCVPARGETHSWQRRKSNLMETFTILPNESHMLLVMTLARSLYIRALFLHSSLLAALGNFRFAVNTEAQGWNGKWSAANCFLSADTLIPMDSL